MSNDPNDVERLADELRDLDPPLALTLHLAAETGPFSAELERIANDLVRVSEGRILLRRADDEGAAPAAPALTLSRTGGGDVHWLALPEGPEEAPFLEAARGASAGPETLPAELDDGLAGLERRAALLVFVAAACPHCPRAVSAASRLARASERVSVSVVDAQRFPELAERLHVNSTPTTFLDEGRAWVGEVEAAELARSILARGTAEHELAVFRSLVETGRFDEAIASMESGEGARCFVAAWEKSSTSSRIGLMLTAERLLERGDAPFHPVAEDLARVTETDDVPLRGDTADLLGRIDHPAARAALEKLLEDPDPDVAEIAAEGLGLDE